MFLWLIIFTSAAISNAGETCLRAIAISGGEYHTLVLMENKTVWACGSNNLGRLGIGTAAIDISPILVQTIGGTMGITFLEDIVAVDAGWRHSLAVDDINGNVWAWGGDDQGQIGNGDTTGNMLVPVAVHAGEQSTDPMQF